MKSVLEKISEIMKEFVNRNGAEDFENGGARGYVADRIYDLSIRHPELEVVSRQADIGQDLTNGDFSAMFGGGEKFPSYPSNYLPSMKPEKKINQAWYWRHPEEGRAMRPLIDAWLRRPDIKNYKDLTVRRQFELDPDLGARFASLTAYSEVHGRNLSPDNIRDTGNLAPPKYARIYGKNMALRPNNLIGLSALRYQSNLPNYDGFNMEWRGFFKGYNNHQVTEFHRMAKASPEEVRRAEVDFKDDLIEQWEHMQRTLDLFVVPIRGGRNMTTGTWASDYRNRPSLAIYDINANGRIDLDLDRTMTNTGNPLSQPSGIKLYDNELNFFDVFKVLHTVYGHARPGIAFGGHYGSVNYQSNNDTNATLAHWPMWRSNLSRRAFLREAYYLNRGISDGVREFKHMFWIADEESDKIYQNALLEAIMDRHRKGLGQMAGRMREIKIDGKIVAKTLDIKEKKGGSVDLGGGDK